MMNHVYLVVAGHTRASVLGQYVTAASGAPHHSDTLQGGDLGAWIGEMIFLGQYKNPTPSLKNCRPSKSKDSNDKEENDKKSGEVKEDEAATPHPICIV
eukprot:5059844-Ditylum_brightwellii.AAC.1